MDDPACALDQALNGIEIGEIGDDDLFAVESRGEFNDIGRAQGAIFLDQTRPQPASEDACGTSEQGRACIGHWGESRFANGAWTNLSVESICCASFFRM